MSGCLAPIPVEPGTCGHPLADHYTYTLNGRPQVRCRSCDPHARRRDMPTVYAMNAGSDEAAMYAAADHDYVGLKQ